MSAMKIRYNKTLAVSALVVGGLLLVFSLGTQQWISVFAGAVLAVLGGLMLVNPMVSIETHEVQLRNPIGMTLKRFPVTSPADLSLQGNALRHVPGDKKIVTLGIGADKTDMARLRAQLAGESV